MRGPSVFGQGDPCRIGLGSSLCFCRLKGVVDIDSGCHGDAVTGGGGGVGWARGWRWALLLAKGRGVIEELGAWCGTESVSRGLTVASLHAARCCGLQAHEAGNWPGGLHGDILSLSGPFAGGVDGHERRPMTFGTIGVSRAALWRFSAGRLGPPCLRIARI